MIVRDDRIALSRAALSGAGLTTFVSFAPAYPPTGGWGAESIADAFAEAGVAKASTRLLDARWGVREAMLARLAGSPLAGDLARITDRPYMESFLTVLAGACEARGISFRRWDRSRRVGFYGPHSRDD